MRKARHIEIDPFSDDEDSEIKRIQKVVDEAEKSKMRVKADTLEFLDGSTLAALILDLQDLADRGGLSDKEVVGTLSVNLWPDEPLILEVE